MKQKVDPPYYPIEDIPGSSGFMAVTQCTHCGRYYKHSHKCSTQRLFGDDSKPRKTTHADTANGYSSDADGTLDSLDNYKN